MPSALPLRTDYSSADLRRLAKKTKNNNQSRRLLSLAAVLDGMNRTDAGRIPRQKLPLVCSSSTVEEQQLEPRSFVTLLTTQICGDLMDTGHQIKSRLNSADLQSMPLRY